MTTMIRKYKEEDAERVLQIWDDASTKAHPFLDGNFTDKVRKEMREIYIPNGKECTWVFEDADEVVGFLAMPDTEIGGIFVSPNHESEGLGNGLLYFIWKEHNTIEVEVFERNSLGRKVYKKNGFEKVEVYYHPESKQKVLRLVKK